MNFLKSFVPLWLSLVYSQHRIDSPELSCNSISCYGDQFKFIQMSKFTSDNKYFVDMATARSDAEILKDFKILLTNYSKDSFTNFMDTNFYVPGYELDPVIIPNYPSPPPYVNKISNSILKEFATDIHNIWSTLIRKFNPNKICSECHTTLLPLKHNFVIPGGRFREFYYWDSYFVMRGLNLAGLHQISKDMLLNFLDIVETYGLVPNGARRYFLNRSQPPLLIPAAYEYSQSSGDHKFLSQSINTLVKEYNYWISNHTVQVPCPSSMKNCYLTRYIVNTDQPRPESYREDFHTVEKNTNYTKEQKSQLYANLASGAESGWDYSTRWIPDAQDRLGGSQEEILRGIRTSSIIPVDLNSIMYMNEMTLGKIYRKLAVLKASKCSSKKIAKYLAEAEKYEGKAAHRAQLMKFNMWDPVDSTFYDFNVELNKKNKQFSLSNFWPFWTDALTPCLRENPKTYLRAFQKLARVRQSTPGGSPTTTLESKLQWDFPNVWAPLELVLVEGIRKSGHQLNMKGYSHQASKLYQLARKIATRFIHTSTCAWGSSGGPHKGKLFEKYEATQLGMIGGGGEYHIQTGFGWTNGVISQFFAMYPDLQSPPKLDQCRYSFNLSVPSSPYGKFKNL